MTAWKRITDKYGDHDYELNGFTITWNYRHGNSGQREYILRTPGGIEWRCRTLAEAKERAAKYGCCVDSHVLAMS